MKFRLISKYGDGIALLNKIQGEGHDVDYWTNGRAWKDNCKLKRVANASTGLDKDTVIIFDTTGYGAVADKLKKVGYRVYGAGGINDALGLKDAFGMEAARISGLPMPKSERGVELSTEGFYIDGELVPNSLNFALEQRRFMDFDKGPLTGCQTSIVRFWREKRPKIYRMTLKKMEPFLEKFKYSGPLKINCMITGRDDVSFLEWIPRFSCLAIHALMEGLNMEVGKFISDLAFGIKPKLKPSYDWLGAIRVSVPPYPSGDGVVCNVTAGHKELKGLENELYRKIEKLEIPDMQYRSDAVSGIRSRVKKLKDWKYI